MARPNTLYLDLLREVQRKYEPGEWTSVNWFANPASAFVAKRLIERGKRPIPGGVEAWDFQAHKEPVEAAEGGKLDGSVLYARWRLPEERREEPPDGAPGGGAT